MHGPLAAAGAVLVSPDLHRYRAAHGWAPAATLAVVADWLLLGLKLWAYWPVVDAARVWQAYPNRTLQEDLLAALGWLNAACDLHSGLRPAILLLWWGLLWRLAHNAKYLAGVRLNYAPG